MAIRLAICAIVLVSMSFNATAGHNGWGGQNAWDNWKQTDHQLNWNSGKLSKLADLFKKLKQKHNDRWDCDVKQWERDCDWGKEKEKKSKKCKDNDRKCNDKPRDCDPPTAVPSPTAALAGLGVMGLMLGRRRTKKA